MHEVSKALRDHYEKSFRAHGASSQGVDWGQDPAPTACRYEKMLAVIPPHQNRRVSLLDVGCGYGGLFKYAKQKGIALAYTGIDVVESMISEAGAQHSDAVFLHGDILDATMTDHFDYVVCNGILTQKLDVPALVMDEFAARLIRRMFALCRRGIAFNVMTTKVNYFSNNLYYRNPAELIAWCMSELTRHIKLDHAYPLFEYTLYLYREAIEAGTPQKQGANS